MLAQAEESTPLLVGQSPRIRNVLRMVEKLGRCRWPVLLLGETGTGKEVVARSIHKVQPGRAVRHHRLFLPGGPADGERAVRPRERRVHRRRKSQDRLDRSGQRRHRLLRRDRRAAARSAGQAAARSCRRRSSVRSVRSRIGVRTSASSPPPIATWRRKWKREPSAATCSTG